MRKRVLVTGSEGFIGSNLVRALSRRDDLALIPVDVSTSEDDLFSLAAESDYIVHLAGVNRPKDAAEFKTVNTDLTSRLLRHLESAGRSPAIALSSSIQAERDNPYGESKRAAERVVQQDGVRTGAAVRIFRLPNVFGKWCRPYYNSVVATFCHQAAHGEDLSVDDPTAPLQLIHIDDAVALFEAVVDDRAVADSDGYCHAGPVHQITVGELADLIAGFPAIRRGGPLPDLGQGLQKYLYSTYLSYLEPHALAYSPVLKRDNRGQLTELVKSHQAGQVFVSRTVPGVTRGNHYHDTKVEKFCVVEGRARVALRHLRTNEVTTFEVDGHDVTIVDIAPGYTHNITNIGADDLVTLFWANEIFDPGRPDTYFEEV